MKRFAILFIFLIGSLLSGVLVVGQTAAQPPAKSASTKALNAAPTDKEIAEAKARGLVWTNPTTKVYHKGGDFYGKTTSGKFMTEADAIRQYYRPSPDAAKASKAAMPPTKKK